MSVDDTLEKLAVETTRLELAVRRKLKVLMILKQQDPKQAKPAIEYLRRMYVINPEVADMFHMSKMDNEYMNLLTTFEKALDA